MSSTTTIDRDHARDFATTLAACRALARKGRAQAEHLRQLTAATRQFARTWRDRLDRFAEIDRIESVALRAIARGVAPTSVHAWTSARYSRVRLEGCTHV